MKKKSFAGTLYTVLILFFLYAPIAVMIVFSFNAGRSTSVMSGLSFKWYGELFRDRATINSLVNTVIVAVISSIVSTIMGTAAATALFRYKSNVLRKSVLTVTNIPMMNPDIVTGFALMLLFVFCGRALGIQKDLLGLPTLLIAHITFELPYVILNVLPKLRQTDPNLFEAAQDLGCPPLRAYFKVILPAIMPGILAGLMMAFTLSVDDFIISYFVSGPTSQTLPIQIYAMTKRDVTPDMYALSTIIFLVILVMLMLYNGISSQKSPKKVRQRHR